MEKERKWLFEETYGKSSTIREHVGIIERKVKGTDLNCHYATAELEYYEGKWINDEGWLEIKFWNRSMKRAVIIHKHFKRLTISAELSHKNFLDDFNDFMDNFGEYLGLTQ